MATNKHLIYAEDALEAEFVIEQDGAIGYVVDSEVIRNLSTRDAEPVALGRMYATQEFDKLQKAIDTGELQWVKHSELAEPYSDESFVQFADCKECCSQNIVPSRFCRWCGAKLPDFEKYPENY